MGEVRGRGGAPRLERERRLTGPAVRGARHGDDGAGPALPLSPGRLDRSAGSLAGLFGGSGWTVQAGAAGVGDPVALEAAVRPVGDGPLDKPGFEKRIEVAARIARLVGQSEPGEQFRAGHVPLAHGGEDLERRFVEPPDLVTW